MKKELSYSIYSINQKKGGSTLTKMGRATILKHFVETLTKRLNIQLKNFKHLKPEQIKSYINHCKNVDGVGNRTLQNRMAYIRTALRESGCTQIADSKSLSNKTLGIDGTNRDGTHRLPDLNEAINRINVLPNAERIIANLQLVMGLRAREAIQCARSLPVWEREIKQGRPLTIVHGTKGGKNRSVLVDPAQEDNIKKAISEAQMHLKVTGQSEIHPSKTLEGAARSYQRAMAAVGFSGTESSHSLRYAFAQRQFKFHLNETGGDRKEALARLSHDLGHGDGRGRYVNQVYLKGKPGEETEP